MTVFGPFSKPFEAEFFRFGKRQWGLVGEVPDVGLSNDKVMPMRRSERFGSFKVGVLKIDDNGRPVGAAGGEGVGVKDPEIRVKIAHFIALDTVDSVMIKGPMQVAIEDGLPNKLVSEAHADRVALISVMGVKYKQIHSGGSWSKNAKGGSVVFDDGPERRIGRQALEKNARVEPRGLEFTLNVDEKGAVLALAEGKGQLDFEKVVAFTVWGEEVILDPEAVDVNIGGIFRDLDPVARAGDKLKGGVLKVLEKVFIHLQTVALATPDDGWGEAPFVVSDGGIPSIKAGGEIDSAALVNSSGKRCGKDKVDLSVSTVVATVQSELFGLKALKLA